jgi:hypothetical protein
MIDGWSSHHTHYLAVFIVTEESGPQLLSFSPLNDETTLTAASMADSIDWIIGYYELDYAKCIFLVGDNTEVNPALARRLKLNFIGCHSHTLNLAVKKKMLQNSEIKPLIEKVHKMMLKLNSLKRRALLKSKTKLAPKIENATRWTSTFEMLKRYFQIIDSVRELFANDMELDGVEDDAPVDHYSRIKMYQLIPNPDEHAALEKWCTILKPVEEATTSLQGGIIN